MIQLSATRRLRGYAFDPSLSLKMETATINDLVYEIPYEILMDGPIGEYVEVIDFDPTVDKFYQPVNLDNAALRAQGGHIPDETNPQFHQQMVYAVTMTTIKNFEKALGRKVLWSPRRVEDKEVYEEYVDRLRIYPHAMREANAYYSPLKKALLFGYFSSTPADEARHMPDSLVFTCLSHDIIAHETTHAILDGMFQYFNEPTNPDMLAFHEAFADIVALFQHFTFPEVLRHQIAKTRGDLSTQNLLGQLAQEFGNAIGGYGSLRDAIGKIDEVSKEWKMNVPDPTEYKATTEPHLRGSILVAAVFEAFISIYKSRVADLIRIASEGSGILRAGELHPDLVNRLADEAAKSASHVLTMCIRALDYCPPVDLTFGDYLRAIITADADLLDHDKMYYRIAFIEAFRKRGIYPGDIKMLSIGSVLHPILNIGGTVDNEGNLTSYGSFNEIGEDTKAMIGIVNKFLREYANAIKFLKNRKDIFEITRQWIADDKAGRKTGIHGLLRETKMTFARDEDFAKITGLGFVREFKRLGIVSSAIYDGPGFLIDNLRVVERVGPKGNKVTHAIFSIIQTSGVIFRDGKFSQHYDPRELHLRQNMGSEEVFEARGGCTLIFDLDTLKLRYSISKPLIDVERLEKKGEAWIDMKRIEKLYDFQYQSEDRAGNEFARYFGDGRQNLTEPFAFLHQH